MTALAPTPSNVLVAMFPPHSGRLSIRQQAVQERKAAWRASLKAAEAAQVTIAGRSRSYTFVAVSAANREALGAGPVVLLAKRTSGAIAGVEAFEAENAIRLNAWLDRAAVVSDIALFAYRQAGSRIERAAVVADLSPLAVRPCAFVRAGQFDLRAIMIAAIAAAKASRRAAPDRSWGACLSEALREVWQMAKAARASPG